MYWRIYSRMMKMSLQGFSHTWLALWTLDRIGFPAAHVHSASPSRHSTASYTSLSYYMLIWGHWAVVPEYQEDIRCWLWMLLAQLDPWMQQQHTVFTLKTFHRVVTGCSQSSHVLLRRIRRSRVSCWSKTLHCACIEDKSLGSLNDLSEARGEVIP